MIKRVGMGAMPTANFERIAAILGFFHKFLECFTKLRNFVNILDFFLPFLVYFAIFVNFVANFGNKCML